MILFFVNLGRFLDKKNKAKTMKTIEELVQITPENALVKVGNSEKKVTIDEMKVGDILICKPGMKIAGDGTIEVISTLKKLTKQVIMLTGDNKEVATIVAEEIGISEVYADMLPKDKRDLINKFKSDGKKVMMIGDEINDALSLVLADIRINLKNAPDIATSSVDVIFLKNDLTSILDFVIISKKTLKNIYENLFWAFLYNTITIPIAIGLLKSFNITINPMIASLSMTLSSLTVVFNALRLKKSN